MSAYNPLLTEKKDIIANAEIIRKTLCRTDALGQYGGIRYGWQEEGNHGHLPGWDGDNGVNGIQ